MKINYREATANDAEAMLLHLHTVGGETDNLSFGKDDFNISPEKEARFIERFHRSEDDLMLVAEEGGIIVGNGIIEREKIKRYSHRAELSITVIKDCWGQGIGSELMKRMIEFARSRSLHALTLIARADNMRAVSLYERFGFEKVGISKDYFKINGRYFDAVYMQLLL